MYNKSINPQNLRPVKKSERLYNRHLRQLHFIDAVDTLWKDNGSVHPNLSNLCKVVAQSPAPQFYISPKHALEKYNLYLQTGTIHTDCPYTRQMYLDIFTRFQSIYLQKNNIDFKYAIMQDVLDTPAPSFYINPSSALAFYYRSMAYRRSLCNKA